MTNDNNEITKEEIKECIIKNSYVLDEMLKNDLKNLKNTAISSDLNDFWDEFEKKLSHIKNKQKENQVLNMYVVLTENRTIRINEIENKEPWFILIKGIDCENGTTEQDMLNVRKNEQEIIMELVDIN